MTSKRRLVDVLPKEMYSEYDETRAFQMMNDAIILEEKDGCKEEQWWPGIHRYVYIWWVVEYNGKKYAVGWNQNPTNKGWSFPVMRYYNE